MSGSAEETYRRHYVPADSIQKWQKTVDLMAAIFDVPAGLIMRVLPSQIEVLLASKSSGNPYKLGETAELNTGLYCETVMAKQRRLVVPNALDDPEWQDNPDLALNMISYMGVPLICPDGSVFGTICVLDDHTRNWSPVYRDMLFEFRGIIEQDLRMLDQERQLRLANELLTQARETADARALEAELLRHAVEIGAESNSFHEALQYIVDKVCEMTEWPVGHVYEPSPMNTDELVPTTIWHLSDPGKFAVFREATERTNFLIGVGLPGRILKSGEPAWIANVEVDPNFPRNKLGNTLGVKGAFGFPVKVDRDVVAVLEFFTDTQMAPDQSLLVIIDHLGEQLGRVFERKRAEENLRQAHEETRKKNEELRSTLEELTTTQTELVQSEKMAVLGKITAGVAHELNNPIGAIKSAADVSGRCVSKMNGVMQSSNSLQESTGNQLFRKSLSILESSSESIAVGSDRISRIVASLENFSRLDEAAFQKVDLHEGIESTLILIQFAIKDGTRIVKEFGDLPEFYCNPGEMNQVFMVLLTKAVEAVAEGGMVTIRTSADENNIRVEITDTGKGIPPEALETIFDLNFRTKDQRIGIGLELPNAHNIIMRHKGDLKVESKIGKGTQFTIVLPDSGINRQRTVLRTCRTEGSKSRHTALPVFHVKHRREHYKP